MEVFLVAYLGFVPIFYNMVCYTDGFAMWCKWSPVKDRETRHRSRVRFTARSFTTFLQNPHLVLQEKNKQTYRKSKASAMTCQAKVSVFRFKDDFANLFKIKFNTKKTTIGVQ